MNLNFKNEEYAKILSKIQHINNVNKDNICAICRDPLLIDTIDLHCNHRYHTECLLNSFVKYESKKCPLCNEHFLIDSYQTSCCQVMKNKKICDRKCYNNERLCSTHIKTYLKQLAKQAEKNKKDNKKEIASIKRKIKSRENKVKKLNKELKTLDNEIIHLNNELTKLQ